MVGANSCASANVNGLNLEFFFLDMLRLRSLKRRCFVPDELTDQ